MGTKMLLLLGIVALILPQVLPADLGHAPAEEEKKAEAANEEEQKPVTTEVKEGEEGEGGEEEEEQEEEVEDSSPDHDQVPNWDPESDSKPYPESKSDGNYPGGYGGLYDSETYQKHHPMYPDPDLHNGGDPESRGGMDDDDDERMMYPDHGGMMDPDEMMMRPGARRWGRQHAVQKWYAMFSGFCRRMRFFDMEGLMDRRSMHGHEHEYEHEHDEEEEEEEEEKTEEEGKEVKQENEEDEGERRPRTEFHDEEYMYGLRDELMEQCNRRMEPREVWPTVELMRLIFTVPDLTDRFEEMVERYRVMDY